MVISKVPLTKNAPVVVLVPAAFGVVVVVSSWLARCLLSSPFYWRLLLLLWEGSCSWARPEVVVVCAAAVVVVMRACSESPLS